jgi:hypothetical protein
MSLALSILCVSVGSGGLLARGLATGDTGFARDPGRGLGVSIVPSLVRQAVWQTVTR